jgi:putative membrane protein (TIGR04086 family)
VYGIYFVSGVVGGFFSGKLMQKRRIVWAIMTGMLYCMILMCGFIVNQNLQESSVLFLWGCTTIGAILGGIVS